MAKGNTQGEAPPDSATGDDDAKPAEATRPRDPYLPQPTDDPDAGKGALVFLGVIVGLMLLATAIGFMQQR